MWTIASQTIAIIQTWQNVNPINKLLHLLPSNECAVNLNELKEGNKHEKVYRINCCLDFCRNDDVVNLCCGC